MRFKLLFFSIVLCKLISAQVYSGLPFNFSHGLTIDSLFVADSGALSDIDLKISMSSTSYIRLLRLVLISPSETPITLFDGILDGTTLYQTIFDDSANTVITDGSPPYIGRYRPIESFSPIIGN